MKSSTSDLGFSILIDGNVLVTQWLVHVPFFVYDQGLIFAKSSCEIAIQIRNNMKKVLPV